LGVEATGTDCHDIEDGAGTDFGLAVGGVAAGPLTGLLVGVLENSLVYPGDLLCHIVQLDDRIRRAIERNGCTGDMTACERRSMLRPTVGPDKRADFPRYSAHILSVAPTPGRIPATCARCSNYYLSPD
jgi:hypothetical protein